MSATTKKNLLKVSHPILTRVKEYFMMALGMAIYSFGWIGCVLPAKGTSGAASGLAIVISTALHNSFGLDVKIGTLVLLINAVLLLIAGFILGWKFGIKTIFCIICFRVVFRGMPLSAQRVNLYGTHLNARRSDALYNINLYNFAKISLRLGWRSPVKPSESVQN